MCITLMGLFSVSLHTASDKCVLEVMVEKGRLLIFQLLLFFFIKSCGKMVHDSQRSVFCHTPGPRSYSMLVFKQEHAQTVWWINKLKWEFEPQAWNFYNRWLLADLSFLCCPLAITPCLISILYYLRVPLQMVHSRPRWHSSPAQCI